MIHIMRFNYDSCMINYFRNSDLEFKSDLTIDTLDFGAPLRNCLL